MPVIKFSAWAPDQPRFGNTCITATNVYPIANGYAPFPDASSASDALSAACIGSIELKRVDGTIDIFAGTATKLYKLSGSSWTDVSAGGGSYSSATRWRFALYGSRLVATNGVDSPQAYDLGTDSAFAALPNAPVHSFPMVIRDVLVAVDVQDGSIYEVKWSAVADSETWSADCGGGAQDFPDGGPVVGGTGGEFGVILQEYGLTRMNFVGGDLRFTFDKIEGSVGCIAPDSIVQYKGRTFYLSEEGFQVFGGAESENISDEFVSDTFFAAVDDSNFAGVQGALDPRNSSVVWRYPLAAGGSKLIIFNYKLGRWSEADPTVNNLHTGITSTGQVLSAFDSSNELVRFTGSGRSAVLSTGDIQLAPDRGSFVRSVRGLVDSAHDVTVGKKTGMADVETTVSGSSNVNGKVSLRSNGRYHRFQLEPTATFTELVGVEVDAVPSARAV